MASSQMEGLLGHQLIDRQGCVCNCGRTGCLETFVGGPAIVGFVLSNKALVRKLDTHKRLFQLLIIYTLAAQGHRELITLTDNVFG